MPIDSIQVKTLYAAATAIVDLGATEVEINIPRVENIFEQAERVLRAHEITILTQRIVPGAAEAGRLKAGPQLEIEFIQRELAISIPENRVQHFNALLFVGSRVILWWVR